SPSGWGMLVRHLLLPTFANCCAGRGFEGRTFSTCTCLPRYAHRAAVGDIDTAHGIIGCVPLAIATTEPRKAHPPTAQQRRKMIRQKAADRSSSGCESAYATLAVFFARCPPPGFSSTSAA